MILKCIKYKHLLIQFITIFSNIIFYFIIIIIWAKIYTMYSRFHCEKMAQKNVNIFNEL